MNKFLRELLDMFILAFSLCLMVIFISGFAFMLSELSNS